MVTDDGLRAELWPDSNVFSVNTIVAIAGIDKNVARSWKILTGDPRFHFHKIMDMNGRFVTPATAANSAQAIGNVIKAERTELRMGNLLRGPFVLVGSVELDV